MLALLGTAERDLNTGQPEEAAVVLERALLIEPRNPTVWYYLLRRERAAWSNATGSQSIIVFDGRQYRRVVRSEGNRRRRY